MKTENKAFVHMTTRELAAFLDFKIEEEHRNTGNGILCPRCGTHGYALFQKNYCARCAYHE